jgi:cation diffusion facilitator family transporter
VSKFPSPIPLSESVALHHRRRYRTLSSAAKQGVFLRLAIACAELMGFYYYGSYALFADALSTLLDISTSLFLIFCLKKAHEPPDHNHPLGHGRLEPVAGLQIALMIGAIGAVLFYQQLLFLLTGGKPEALSSHTWLIPFFAVLLLEFCHQRAKRAAIKADSPALMADAMHYRLDGIGTLFALIALLFSSSFYDRIGAILIAGMMIVIGILSARRNLHQLLDRSPPAHYFDKVRSAAMSVPGILATEKLLIQLFGPDAQVSIDVEVDPSLSVDIAHEMTQKVRAAIQEAWPSVRDVIVHVEPYYPNDH